MTLIYADDRTTFLVEHDERYALGDPGAPMLTLNAQDADGCVWVADVPDGWDFPEVETPIDRRQDGHGGYAGEPTYNPRSLSFEGTVSAPSYEALRRAYRRLVRAVLGSVPDYVRYTHLDEDGQPGLWLLPTGKPKWRALDDRVATFAFVMVAEDPIKTGAASTYGPVRLPAPGGEGGYAMVAGGLPMPATAGGTPVGMRSAYVPNLGDEDSHAVYTVTGPVPQPQIRLGTGEYVALTTDLAAGDRLVVDTAAGTVTINGVNRYDAWGAGSTFPLIPGSPGGDPAVGVPELPAGANPSGGTTVVLRSGSGGSDQTAGLWILTAPSWK